MQCGKLALLILLLCLPLQVNLSTASKAFQTVDSDLFYVQLDLISNDTNFNNTHPRLQVASSPHGLMQSEQAIAITSVHTRSICHSVAGVLNFRVRQAQPSCNNIATPTHKLHKSVAQTQAFEGPEHHIYMSLRT